MNEPSKKPLLPTRRRRAALLASTSLVAALAAAPGVRAQQVLPTNGSVASGAASIGQNGAGLTINQTSSRAVINWNSFSIGAGNSVTFVQPGADAAVLNRVTGATPSSIAGRLDANGQVFLVNPNGIAITKSGTVNVGGGFAASTLAIRNRDFNEGRLNFQGGGASAPVSNAGEIVAAPGGFVSLLGGSVSNSGVIVAPLGKVALGSGEQATLDPTGDGFLQVALPTDAKTADGKALVDVSGTVKAAGGTVAIKAATAANAVRNAINLSGYVSARSARQVGGSIVLGGGDGGDVRVVGELNASGRKGGGSIAVTGRNVALNNAKLIARSDAGVGGAVAATGTGAVRLKSSKVNVSGADGGGVIAVGGSPHGQGPLANAAKTTLVESALIADALTSGQGGAITVWSSGVTTVGGRLSARGGALSGDGGSVETSGATATLHGAHVDTTAPHGAAGLWTIDPTDFTIAASGGDMTGAEVSRNLATTPVTIMSDRGMSGVNGDIFVDDAVSWSSGNTLTLDAARNIQVNANITVNGAGGLTLIYGDPAQGGTTPGALVFALTDAGSTGSASFTGAGGSLTINTVSYTLLRTEADLAQLTATAGGNFALARSFSLTQTYQTDVVPDFYGRLEGLGNTLQNLVVTPNGAAANVGFFGILDAHGSGTPAAPPAGAVGTVSDLFLANVNVTGGGATGVGALAGENFGHIVNSGSSGIVTGTGSSIGGLVGANPGLITSGYSSVVVTGSSTTGSGIGGLVGNNSGGVVGGLASGDVTGDDSVGGLVGLNTGYVNAGASGFIVGNNNTGGVVGQNGPTGTEIVFQGADVGAGGTVVGAFGFGGVFGTTTAGGVVGLNNGTVNSSYFNGPVGGDTNIGGVVGLNNSAVSESYAIGAVTGAGVAMNIGGLVGQNVGSIDSSFALGAVSGTTNVGGLVGLEGSPPTTSSVSNSYSTGVVSGTTGVGGLIGALGGGDDTVTNAYWDTTTSGQATSAGGFGAGHTTAELQGGAALALGTNFAGGAAGGETGVYPYLSGLFPAGVHAVSGFAFKAGAAPLASGAAGAATVYGDSEGSVKQPGTTGVNGYYYLFFKPGALAAGADLVTYTVANGATGATNAATYLLATGANNQTGVTIFPSTLTETTALPTYSQLVAAVANATAGDDQSPGALAGVGFINITSTGADFRVDQAINTTADLTITGATTLAADVTATGGVNFNSPVTLASTVTVDSGAATTVFASTIDGSATPGVGLTVNGPVALGGDVTTANGALTFNGPVTVNNNLTLATGTATTTFGSTIDSGADGTSLFYSLTGAAGAFAFGGAIGGNFALGALSLTSTGAMALPAVNAVSIFGQTTGAGAGLTLNGALTASGNGTAVTLVSSGAFTNNVGAGAIVLTGDPQWLVYLTNPTGNVYNGLDSGNYPIWNTAYPGTGVPATGNYYVFAFQPTVTFTSINDAKTYGQDVTARVATDFAVSGIQPAVAGAYLGGVAAGAYTGAPTVTSAGSPATASVAGGPYAINVAPGSLAALNGYALAFASTGQLAVGAEAITVTAAPNTRNYDATTAAAATPTVTTGTLFDAATLSETYATPNAGTGLTLTPKIAFASAAAAGNYIVTLASAATGTINPEPITVTAAPNTRNYDATTAAAATPTVTTGTLFDAATLTETYATPNAGTGLTLTPQIAFGSATTAGNYAVTLASAATGTINPEPITITAAPNTRTYNATTAAAATPTVTTGTLFDAATLTETYATPNAGTGLTLTPQIAFGSATTAANYAVTLASAATGTINPEPITVTAAPNTRTYDATTAAAATPTVTAGTLFDAATLSETYATPNAGTGLTLTPQIAFGSATTAGNYAVTLASAATGTINPEPITITAAPNTRTYDATTAAAATPTLTAGTLFDAATLSETYATPNAGTGLTLTPQIAFGGTTAAGNYAVTLASAATGTINREPITVTATPNTKIFDGNTSAAALPLLTAGTLFDPANLSETYANPGPGPAIALNPAISFVDPAAANNYQVTLVPTGLTPPNTGVILSPLLLQVNLSPSVFVNRNTDLGMPGVSTCGVDLQLPDTSTFADPAAAIQAISAATAQYVERCRDASQEDIADALDRYADALNVIIQKLPPKLRAQLHNIPAIVHAAAARARVAPTRAAAIRVLRQTVAQVQREISLVRAEDPDSARIRNAVSSGVSSVLNSGAVALARAEGI